MNIRNTTILLVEDNPDDATLTLRALKKNHIGNKVIVVEDGVEALDFLFCRNRYSDRSPEDPPQLVLLDLRLPKIDGMEVLRRIRADERTRNLPVVILTASEEEQNMIESYKSGANAFMHKPVDFHQFREAVPQLGMSWVLLNGEPTLEWCTVHMSAPELHGYKGTYPDTNDNERTAPTVESMIKLL